MKKNIGIASQVLFNRPSIGRHPLNSLNLLRAVDSRTMVEILKPPAGNMNDKTSRNTDSHSKSDIHPTKKHESRLPKKPETHIPKRPEIQHPKNQLKKFKSKVHLGRQTVQIGRDNLALSDVSTDSDEDEDIPGRKRIITINCGEPGVLDLESIGFEVMGGRTYGDDDDYDDPSIYVMDVKEGHDVANTIEAGDKIIKIGGHPVLDVPLHHALNLLRAADSRIVIEILKHPENMLGPQLPDDSDDDSGPAESGHEDSDIEQLDDDFGSNNGSLPTMGLNAGVGLFVTSFAELDPNLLMAGSKQGSLVGSKVGSKAGSKVGSVEGSRSSTLSRGANAGSTAALDETDGGQEVEVGFFSGRPGQLDELDFEFAGGRDTPFIPKNGGIFITKVKFGSVLEESIAPGDKIIKLEGIDVSNVPQYTFINLVRASHGKATMIVRKANKQQINASVFQDDIEVSINALGAQDELIIEIKTGPTGRRGNIGFKITGGRDKPCKPGDTGVFIKAVKPGSKLEKILKPGDKLLKVDGKNVTHATQSHVMDLIRKADRRVLLHIKRPIFEEEEERRKQKTISEIFDAGQVEEFLSAFELYSSPIDQKMRLADLRKLCNALGFNMSSQDIESMVTTMKQDNPDKHRITFMEFLYMIRDFSKYLQKDADIHEAFEIFDREHLGFFLLDELKSAFQLMPGYSTISEDEMEEIMKIADSNGDGKVYYQDFKDLVLPIFHKY